MYSWSQYIHVFSCMVCQTNHFLGSYRISILHTLVVQRRNGGNEPQFATTVLHSGLICNQKKKKKEREVTRTWRKVSWRSFGSFCNKAWHRTQLQLRSSPAKSTSRQYLQPPIWEKERRQIGTFCRSWTEGDRKIKTKMNEVSKSVWDTFFGAACPNPAHCRRTTSSRVVASTATPS